MSMHAESFPIVCNSCWLRPNERTVKETTQRKAGAVNKGGQQCIVQLQIHSGACYEHREDKNLRAQDQCGKQHIAAVVSTIMK